MTSPQAAGSAATTAGFAAGPGAGLGPGERPDSAPAPPPCRGAGHMARRPRSGAGARRQQAPWRCPDRAARRRDRAATGPWRRARPPSWRSRRGFRSSDRPGPAPRAWPAPPGSRRYARIPATPAAPRRARARRGPHRSPLRIPAGSGTCRCPRCAAAGARRPRRAISALMQAPTVHDRGADIRWATGRSGKRVAWLFHRIRFAC